MIEELANGNAAFVDVKVKELDDNQLKDFKLNKLPPFLIVFSGLKNFVNDVSEGMTCLKNKYSDRLPSNITTLNVKNSDDEKDFLSYGNSAKSLYLLLQES